MALLSFANHSIITYGTFAMWSALFSRKGEVVMPEDHVKTELGRKIQMAQIPNWKFIWCRYLYVIQCNEVSVHNKKNHQFSQKSFNKKDVNWFESIFTTNSNSLRLCDRCNKNIWSYLYFVWSLYISGPVNRYKFLLVLN